MMATRSDADANISYYGVGLDNLLGDLGKVTKPLIVHIADKDEFFLPDRRAHRHETGAFRPELPAAGPPAITKSRSSALTRSVWSV